MGDIQGFPPPLWMLYITGAVVEPKLRAPHKARDDVCDYLPSPITVHYKVGLRDRLKVESEEESSPTICILCRRL
jgi:hypothetical protein